MPVRPTLSWNRGGRGIVVAILATAAYVGAAAWAHQFAVTSDRGLTVWYPGPGILVGLLIEAWRFRFALALFAGELLASVLVFHVQDSFSPAQLVLNAALITTPYALGALVTRRLRRAPGPPAALRDLVALSIGGVVVGSLGAACFGTAMRHWCGLDDGVSYEVGIRLWFVSDAVGVLALAPAVMLAVWRSWMRTVRVDLVTVASFIGLLAGPTVLLTLGGDRPFRFVYLVFFPVVLLAVRHGVAGAVPSVALTHVALTMEVSRLGGGTLGRDDLQTLLLVASITGLVIGLLVSERDHRAGRLAQLGTIVESTLDLVATVGADGRLRYLNAAGHGLLDLPPDQPVAGLPASMFFLDAMIAPAIAGNDDRSEGIGEVRRLDGTPVVLSYVRLPHDDGTEVVVSVIGRDITQQRRTEQELEHRALHDGHTGLANRALLIATLERACARAERSGRRIAVLRIDLDRFRTFNDTHGHGIADDLLLALASRLQNALTPTELAARIGGDEFGVIVEDITDADAVVALAETIRDALSEPLELAGTTCTIEASCGVAVSEAGHAEPARLMRQAGAALQAVKRTGGGHTARFDPAGRATEDARRELAVELALAVREGTWTLHYQPILAIEDRHVVAVEALFRWTNPRLGLLPAAEVVEIAEETGLITTLGFDILRRACAELVDIDPGGRLGLKVNVSPVQLRGASAAERTVATIVATGFPTNRLTVEVTETALMAELDAVAEVLGKLREAGVAVALDDFGTGYSSLARLRGLPIDEVKIDRTFVSGLGHGSADDVVVPSVLQLTRQLGLTSVAEGVEETRQLDQLVAFGCDQVQGYLFARPMAAEPLRRYLAGAH